MYNVTAKYRSKRFVLDGLRSRIKKSPSGCWLWQAGKSNGYGWWFSQPAHRVVWKALRGRIPKNKIMRHQCDHKHCVNPKHFLLGDNGDNMMDKRLLSLYRKHCAWLVDNDLTIASFASAISGDSGTVSKWLRGTMPRQVWRRAVYQIFPECPFIGTKF